MIKKNKIFKIDTQTAKRFTAIADLTGESDTVLLTAMMNHYADTVEHAIINVANQYPVFATQYPWIERLDGVDS